MDELLKSAFELEIIEMLTPKIRTVLKETNRSNRRDLEQELILMILSKINKKDFDQKPPSFFQLMEEELQNNTL
ncbi:hypothetical protein [Viridibacillus arvi]|uniref:hypothetical protein n=1 Tax=Viridibacillus arvi TaxID=263475 RepID=UPI003D0254A6